MTWLSSLLLLTLYFTLGKAQVDPDVSHIFVGLRHGIRNPGDFCCGYSSPVEAYMLTRQGKEEAYNNGRFVRERYPNLVDAAFKSSQISATSSSADRCQQTLQAFLAGFYAPIPGTGAIPGVNWEPIAYKIDNPLLRMYSVDECPEQIAAWDPISYDTWPPMQAVLREKATLIDFVIAKSGFKVGSSKLSTMADIADNIINQKIIGQEPAPWVKAGMPGVDDLEEAILEFGEIHQIACAQYGPCRRMMSGLWMNNILDVLQGKLNGKVKEKRMDLYASHTEITLAAIYSMGVDQNLVKEVPMGGGFIVEFKEIPSPMVRVLYLHPNVMNVKEEPELRVVTPGGADWLPAAEFMMTLKTAGFSDWKAECKIPNTAPSVTVGTSGGGISPGAGSVFDNLRPLRPPVAAKPVQNCADASPACASWASQGHCDINPSFMMVFCQKSCNCCGCTLSDVYNSQFPESCEDRRQECGAWAKAGDCNTNSEYMNIFCRRSCSQC